MRVLHTADWHLGQRFAGQHRKEEHDHFLDWLYTLICEQNVEVLVVAGDVFDTAHPPAFAQEQYYQFLARLAQSPCRNIVITGGNHDNPHFLQAALPVLRALNVHVVGAATNAPEEQVLILPHPEAARLVVAAIPFLREGDLRKSRLGESSEAIEAQLQASITRHYQAVGDCCAGYRAQGVPVLATGHLYAQGGQLSDTERSIHVGNLGQIGAGAFPEVFDYVALGHLHRPQQVSGLPHIRYSGSPIPLSFSEWQYAHQVLLLHFQGACCPEIETIRVPLRRRLLRREAPLEALLDFLEFFEKEEAELPVWTELIATGCVFPEEARRKLLQAANRRRSHLSVIRLRIVAVESAAPAEAPEQQILSNEIMQHPEQVFSKLLDQREILPDDSRRKELETTFGALLDAYYQRGEHAP